MPLRQFFFIIGLMISYISYGQLNAIFNVSNSNPCTDEGVIFTYPNNTGATSWKWNFGADAFPDSSSSSGPHIVSYGSAGAKTVTLTVSNGITNDTRTAVINVQASPSPAFTVTGLTNVIPTTLSFNATSGGVTYDYDFGDRFSGNYNTSNSRNNSKQYNFGGNYFACLTVAANNCKATECKEIIINAGNNSIQSKFNISPSKSTCVGNQVSITEMGISSSTVREWHFGSNASPTSSTSLNPPVVSWSTPGPKIVTMKTGTGGNNANIKVGSILYYVYPYPTSNFDFEGNACQLPSTINFKPQQQAGYLYNWDFGDGTTSNSTQPSKTYTTTGTKNATLAITKNGCTTYYTRTININNCNSNTKPSFTATASNNHCLAQKYTFNYTGLPASSYLWNFGLGATPPTSTSSTQIVVSYGTSGPHTVTLTINGNETVTSIIK